jgi:hypothetical protein
VCGARSSRRLSRIDVLRFANHGYCAQPLQLKSRHAARHTVSLEHQVTVMAEAKQHPHEEEPVEERRDALVPTTSSSGSDRGAGEDLTQMLQQRLAELEQLTHLNKVITHPTL